MVLALFEVQLILPVTLTNCSGPATVPRKDLAVHLKEKSVVTGRRNPMPAWLVENTGESSKMTVPSLLIIESTSTPFNSEVSYSHARSARSPNTTSGTGLVVIDGNVPAWQQSKLPEVIILDELTSLSCFSGET